MPISGFRGGTITSGVSSVNGQIGDVILDAGDVGAVASSYCYRTPEAGFINYSTSGNHVFDFGAVGVVKKTSDITTSDTEIILPINRKYIIMVSCTAILDSNSDFVEMLPINTLDTVNSIFTNTPNLQYTNDGTLTAVGFIDTIGGAATIIVRIAPTLSVGKTVTIYNLALSIVAVA